MISFEVKGSGKLQQALAERLGNLQNSPTLRVGFLETEKYPDGTPVAMVAFWQEYGTKTAPPRPFFRPTITSKETEWAETLAQALRYTNNNVEQALGLLGERMTDDITKAVIDVNSPALSPVTLWMRKLRGGGRDREPFAYSMLVEARKRAAAGETPTGINTKPLDDTGQMKVSVAWDLEG